MRRSINVFIVLAGILVLVSLYTTVEADTSGQYFKGNGGYGQILSGSFSDLDYTKSFSVEAVIDVKPYENKQRYEGIVTKTTSLYSNTSGWGLGLLQDVTHGASIYAKVGDGVNQLSIYDGGDNYGRLHLVMCWDVDSKTLKLYINGEKVKEAVNLLIDPEKIANTCNFWLGKNLGRLVSPIIYARLWNRDLSEDVQTLFTRYSDTKQHQLPEGFDINGLVSEWLMFEECDASGNPGTTHVKDTVDSNHIQMLDSAGKTNGKDIADIVSSAGNLEAVSPVDGVINQHKSVYLAVKGGYQTLSTYGTVKGPVQYYFQIDQTDTFDSPSLKESRWIADFSSWQPILNPGTNYCWRVKVKDSGITPLESEYTLTYSFTTEAPGVWYVRPAGGNYGIEDGTSYDNAWDGLDSIKWGEAGVEAGDTLYICGVHIRTAAYGGYLSYYGAIIPGVSGTKEHPIMIRGDFSLDDLGVVWGAWKDERPGGMRPENWIEQGSGVYYNMSAADYNFACDNYGLFEGIEEIDYKDKKFTGHLNEKKYKKLGSKEAVLASEENGVYYMRQADPNTYKNRHEIWLKPFDLSNFAQRIRWSGSGGWCFGISEDNSYIEFHDIVKICGSIGHEAASATAGPYHDYTFKNCKFFYSGYVPYNSYNLTFDGCEFAYMSNGFYIIWNLGSIHHITIKNCYFHDIGRQNGDSGTDGHGIGVQNNEYIYILNNRFERCGSAICFHAGLYGTMKHFYILNNFINDMREGYGVDNGGGIIISGYNDNPLGNCEDMIIANNIVTNCHEIGICSNRKGVIEIYNNVVQNCTPSYLIMGCRLDGAGGNFFNNISLNPAPYYSVWNPIFLRDYPLHFYFRQLGESGDPNTYYDFHGDNNLYYPNADHDKAFHFYARGTASVGTNFTEWKKGHFNYGDTVDTHSLLSAPLFKNESGNYNEPEDFQLQWDSSIIDAGIEINEQISEHGYIRAADYLGNPIYGLPDMGAIEYQPPYSMGEDKPDKAGNIRVYGDGKFRNKSEPSGITVDLAVMPINGNTSQYIDISVDAWEQGVKKWKEESTTMGNNSVNHAVADLKVNMNYLIKVNSIPGGGIAGCPGGVVKSDSQGKINFKYQGGYSQPLIFEVEETAQLPLINGDIDNDGDVDVSDLQLCVNVVLGVETNPDIVNRADVDNSGGVDVNDIQKVANLLLGG